MEEQKARKKEEERLRKEQELKEEERIKKEREELEKRFQEEENSKRSKVNDVREENARIMEAKKKDKMGGGGIQIYEGKRPGNESVEVVEPKRARPAARFDPNDERHLDNGPRQDPNDERPLDVG